MKIQKRKNTNRKKLLLLFFVVLLALIVGALIYFGQQPGDDVSKKQDDSSKTTTDKSDTPTETDNQKSPPPASPDVDPSKTTNEIPTSEAISVNISKLVQSGDVISYSADISGATNGKCSALFTSKMGKPVTRVTETTNGKCTADISALEFDALGDWTLQLTFYSNNTQASTSKVITVK